MFAHLTLLLLAFFSVVVHGARFGLVRVRGSAPEPSPKQDARHLFMKTFPDALDDIEQLFDLRRLATDSSLSMSFSLSMDYGSSTPKPSPAENSYSPSPIPMTTVAPTEIAVAITTPPTSPPQPASTEPFAASGRAQSTIEPTSFNNNNDPNNQEKEIQQRSFPIDKRSTTNTLQVVMYFVLGAACVAVAVAIIVRRRNSAAASASSQGSESESGYSSLQSTPVL